MEFKTTVVNAYELLGKPRIVIPAIPGADETGNRLQKQLDLEAYIESLNQESNGGKPWVPDFEDGTTKYEPWFWPVKSDTHPSGLVFSGTDYVYTRTNSHCGSRFVFHSENAWRQAINTPEAIDLFLWVWTKK